MGAVASPAHIDQNNHHRGQTLEKCLVSYCRTASCRGLPHLHRVPGGLQSNLNTPVSDGSLWRRPGNGPASRQGSGVGRQQRGLQHSAALSLLVTVRAVLHLGPEMGQIGGKKTETKGKHMFGGPEGCLRDGDTLVLVPGLPAM